MKSLRYILSMLFCNFYRFLRIFPNNDPIMGCMLPFARRDRWWQAPLFAFLTMVTFDIITQKVGIWTVGTSLTYAFLGLLFYFLFKRMKTVRFRTYIGSSVFAVLIFDFLTGPIMSSFFFRMPFAVAFIGQMPFTLMHLASAVTYTAILVPVLDPDIRKSVSSSFSLYVQRLKSIYLNLRLY